MISQKFGKGQLRFAVRGLENMGQQTLLCSMQECKITVREENRHGKKVFLLLTQCHFQPLMLSAYYSKEFAVPYFPVLLQQISVALSQIFGN